MFFGKKHLFSVEGEEGNKGTKKYFKLNVRLFFLGAGREKGEEIIDD